MPRALGAGLRARNLIPDGSFVGQGWNQWYRPGLCKQSGAPESLGNLIKMQVLIHVADRRPANAAVPRALARTQAVRDPVQSQLQEALSWQAASKVGTKV